MNLKPFQDAFSLVELMIVIAIIGIISAVSLGSLSAIQKNTRDSQRQSDLRIIQGALQQFYADNNYFPDYMTLSAGAPLNNCTGKTLPCTATKTYLSTTPKEPTDNTAAPYCYTSLISSSSGSGCAAGGADAGKCHFYKLYAKLEGSTGTLSCGSGSAYNFELTPL